MEDKIFTYPELLQVIMEKAHYRYSIDLARALGVSTRTIERIYSGFQPGNKFKRNLNSLLEKKFSYSLKYINGKRVQVIKKQVFHVKGDFYGAQSQEKKYVNKPQKAPLAQDILLEYIQVLKEGIVSRDNTADILKLSSYKIRKFGARGFSINLPKIFIENNGLKATDKVETFINQDGHLIIKPAKKLRGS